MVNFNDIGAFSFLTPTFFYFFSSPSGWIEFTWNPLSSLERWLAVAGIILLFLLTELNTFYLKFVLWVPPENPLNFARLGFILFWGAVGLRECFQLLDDPECDRYILVVFIK